MRVLLRVAVASVVFAGAGAWAWQTKSTPALAKRLDAGARTAGGPLSVDVYEVRAEPFEHTVPATGTLRAMESVELVSELSRRLLRVHAVEGNRVRKGAPLFELDSSDLRAAIARLDVKLRLANATAERQKVLFGEGLSSKQELERFESDLEVLRAERNELEVTLKKTLIRAPFAGTLGLRQVSVGAWVTPSTQLASFQDTSTLKLDFTLPERYAADIVPGREFRFEVAGQEEPLRGRIFAREPLVDANSRSVLVRGVVENSNADLLPGTFASVALPLRVESALLIPQIAVVPGVEGRRVFVIREGIARSVPVELGVRTTERVQVVAGLSPGERVVVSNLLRIRDGSAIAVKSSSGDRKSPDRTSTEEKR